MEAERMWHYTIMLALALSPDLRAADKQDALRAEVADALKRFYEERFHQPFVRDPDEPEKKPAPPPWDAPLKKLKAGKPDERARAVAFLRELLNQALEHETSRKAPWRSTPYWGGGAEVPARDLRKEFAEELATAAPLEASLPLIRWYLEKERVPGHLEPVVQALGKLESKQADALRAELVTRPHPNAVVVVEALDQLAARKSPLPAERLAELCRHHRTSVRRAARKLNAILGREEPPAFDPKAAMRLKAVRELMDEVIALIPDLPSAKAEFVRVTVRYLDDKKQEKGKGEYFGWQLQRDKGAVTIYTPYASRETLRDGERTKITQSERMPNGVRSWQIDVTRKVEVGPGQIEELIKQVEKATRGEEGRLSLSERGPLTGQFEGRGASLFEAVLGAWLFRAGKEAEAARVVLSAIDTLYEDRHFAEMVKSHMGDKAGYAMLVAFAGDRDYARALTFARQIDKLYPGTRFHEYAREMARQLPGRMDDFKTFKLPTAAEWAALKKKLTRGEQIDYLCERLRLLNCFQMGQPGGYFPDEEQYAEPCGMETNASWGLRKGKTEVINPLTELAGPFNWYAKGKPRPKGLALTLKDVPHLSKHLREDRYMLIVSFWRDFHPDRNLSSTRPAIADIINSLAHRDICQITRWKEMGGKEIDKEIERINRWAKENAEKTPDQLEREALKDEVAGGATWYRVRDRVEALVKAKDKFGYELLEGFLKSEKSDDYDKATVLQVYLEHNVGKAKDLAPKYLSAKGKELRSTAALVVFRTGDKDKARSLVGDAIAEREVDGWTADAVAALLKDGSDESKKQAARLFANRSLAHERHGSRARCIRLFAEAGLKEPYRFYLPLLEVKETQLTIKNEKGQDAGASNFEAPVREVFAKELVEVFGSEKAVAEIARKHPRAADQVAPLKAWLQEQLKEK
jgi:hypothetical protein